MDKSNLLNLYKQSPQLQKLLEFIAIPSSIIWVRGLTGSSLSFVAASLFQRMKRPLLMVMEDKEEAAYYLNDMEHLLGEECVFFYPASYKNPYEIQETDNANVLLRAETINALALQEKPLAIVTYPDALFEKVLTQKELKKNIVTLQVGDTFSRDKLNELLFDYRFNRVDFVSEPGEFSLRGGIIDVFSFSHDEPYRIEFFGNEVTSIRTFDVATQLSAVKIPKISILPNLQHKLSATIATRESFLHCLAPDTLIFYTNSSSLLHQMDVLFEKATEAFKKLPDVVSHLSPEMLFCTSAILKAELDKFIQLSIGSSQSVKELTNEAPVIEFHTKPQPSFNKKFDLLLQHLHQYHEKEFVNYICCANEKQARRLHDIFEELEQGVPYKTPVFSIYAGFVDEDIKLVCYTDHQLFERYYKFRLRDGYAKKQAISLKELVSLKVGDYVTHIDHGIGRFAGLQKIELEGKAQEAIKLIYGENDTLYVSIHSLHKIAKYTSKDGKTPKLYKLGSHAWKNLKQRTKARVKEIAFSLIELYAKRKMQKGFQYASDSYLQHELEASFIYEDTPDQGKATEAVKADMESEHPMDRLICGDVGFGKTEIAIRAAFKAVDNNKQVAVLAPTTVLTFQHFRTFSERLKDFPVTIEYLNRFRGEREKKEILEKLREGTLDIIIGTHLLTSKNIIFKKLGLLIIDEEQKFGVAVKEKLKTLRENVDVLTLTATPIPRTLQFSLMAARDLSVIHTPPPNRYPIETHVVQMNEEVIRDAIRFELGRGGQIFFVHNRIDTIREMGGMLQRLLPDAQIAIAHGQMEGKKLEKLMLDFIEGRFDVLLSTSIIENGLDVPNANTIFINNAHYFGLADLHQIRGRVGRSNKKAFCYFITPPYNTLTDEARKRMEALEQFSDLGSGFQIAMKDLEIRGAGDLLGAEQSGFINDMGFETYQKIMNEAIEELKEGEFKELYHSESSRVDSYVKETQLDTDFELLFPDDYINNISERLNLYTELSTLQTEEELYLFERNLGDRFGTLPPQAIDLLNSVRIKWIATRIGLERITLKKGSMVGYFIADHRSPYYQSDFFARILDTVQTHPQLCRFKEKETSKGLRLLLVFERVNSVEKALERLMVFASKYHEITS